VNVAARTAVSNQAGGTTGSLVSNQVSVAARPSASNQVGGATKPSVSTQVSATTSPSVAKQLNALSNPVALGKPSTLSQPVVSKPAEASPAASHRLASAAPPTPAVKRDAKSNADQTSRNTTRNLEVARAMLSKDDLTEARSHLTAVIAAQSKTAQPRNRDALSLEETLRETLSVREQQRDAVLQAARDCEISGRWICAWHNAGEAMVIDSGSADAKRILSHAMHEAEATKELATAPVVVPSRELRYHH
jgi:hypothetical protein